MLNLVGFAIVGFLVFATIVGIADIGDYIKNKISPSSPPPPPPPEEEGMTDAEAALVVGIAGKVF